MQYANYLSGVSCSTNFMKTEVPKKFWDEAVIVTENHPSFNRYYLTIASVAVKAASTSKVSS